MSQTRYINNDGVDDLIIGASGGDRGGSTDAGETYVLFGKSPPTPTPVPGSDTVYLDEQVSTPSLRGETAIHYSTQA